jgi:hypothetical protein
MLMPGCFSSKGNDMKGVDCNLKLRLAVSRRNSSSTLHGRAHATNPAL